MYKRLGDYIRSVSNKNKDLEVERLLGVNIDNEFMPSIANVSRDSLVKYKLIEKNQFAANLMHVGRDEKVPIALYDDEERSIVSPAYKVFEVKDESVLYPEYLMIEFQRPEFDRQAWFFCDSSVRGGLNWDRFCDLEIPIPAIEKQKKYVDIYRGLQKNQKAYESSLDDLQLICDTYLQDLINRNKLNPLGDYIHQCDVRNSNKEIANLKGVSTEKKLIESKANTTGVDFSSYKILKPEQFVYVSDTSRRGDKIALAMNHGEPCIVSSIYTVFEVTDPQKLIPEFLYLFLQREEFDRYARFHSWGSARETFDWEEMCRVKIPVPPIEVQEAIVTIYNSVKNRKGINKKLKEIVKPLCPVLMKGVMEELEGKETELV
jgi:type I restriction enzyme S subunit